MMSTTCDAKELPEAQVGGRGATETAGQKVSVVTKFPPLLLPEPEPPLEVEPIPVVPLLLPLPLPLPDEDEAPPVPPEPDRTVLWPQSSPHPCCSPETPVSDCV
jgi:hypothetical protein